MRTLLQRISNRREFNTAINAVTVRVAYNTLTSTALRSSLIAVSLALVIAALSVDVYDYQK